MCPGLTKLAYGLPQACEKKQGVLAKLARQASASARWLVKTGTYSIIRHRLPHAM